MSTCGLRSRGAARNDDDETSGSFCFSGGVFEVAQGEGHPGVELPQQVAN